MIRYRTNQRSTATLPEIRLNSPVVLTRSKRKHHLDQKIALLEQRVYNFRFRISDFILKTAYSALCNSIKKLHAVDVGASTIYEEYLDVLRSYGAKDLTDRRIADCTWEFDNTGLTISRISSKRYGKERVVRLEVELSKVYVLYPNSADL